MSEASPFSRPSTSKYVRRILGDDQQKPFNIPPLSNWSDSDLDNSNALINSTITSQQSNSLMSNDITLVDDHNETDSYSTLYTQFLDGLLRFNASEDPFELSMEFEEVCTDHLNIFSQLKRNKLDLDSSQSYNVPFAFDNMLRMERNTWRLARILYQDRTQTNSEYT